MKHIPLPPPPPPQPPSLSLNFSQGVFLFAMGYSLHLGTRWTWYSVCSCPSQRGGYRLMRSLYQTCSRQPTIPPLWLGWELQYPGLIPRPSSVGLHGNEPSITHMLLQCSLVRSPLSTLFILQPTKAVLRGLGMRLVVTYSLPVETFATGKV